MRREKDLLKQWKADLHAIQEEKRLKKKAKKKRIRNIAFRVIQLTSWMARILIVKIMGYGNKEINNVRINKFDQVYSNYRGRAVRDLGGVLFVINIIKQTNTKLRCANEKG
jgi:hypothetical protein